MKFPKRGVHDNKPTPRWLYSAILSLGFEDVCRDGVDVFTYRPRSRMVYCNPPFSKKAVFVERLVELAREGYTVLLLLPFDPSTKWFRRLWCSGANIIIPMARIHGRAARYPSMLAILPGENRVVIVEPDKIIDCLRNLLARV